MKKVLIALMTVTISNCLYAAWGPINGPLSTPWTDQVTPDNAWSEYPRPQMVRDQWYNLNGLWDYSIVARNESRPEQWAGQILVPFPVESSLSGVMQSVMPDQCLWYRRDFKAPELEMGERLLLHFGAVDWESTVWVNGWEVGLHRGGYDPFVYDITEYLIAGDNELIVKVWDPTDQGYQPRGKQVLKPGGIMYTAVTGIWQTVWLEKVPAVYIESLKIVPDIDRKIVMVTVNTSNMTRIELVVLDGTQEVARATGFRGQPIEMAIANPKLWSPDSPFLYDLKVSLLSRGERRGDSVMSYLGIRKIEVRKDSQGINRLMLNNETLFQYGPLDQGWWPDGLYTPANDEAMKYDIVMTKKFGMNMARKHVKYECARWYYWCDKLGLVVWQDMPAGDSGRNWESKMNFRREMKAMIDTLHNFPSIIMWVPFNEGWGQHDTPETVAWVEQYDPTRPVNEASGWTNHGSGTVSDMHNYPGPGMRPVEEDRVSVLGEFGGLGMAVPGHLWQEDRNWGYVSYKTSEELTDAYVGLMTRMRFLVGQGLSAAVYTQTSDVEIEVNGLMTYDRKLVKMDLNRIAEAARKLYLPPPVVKTLVPSSQYEKQTWKFTTAMPDENWFAENFNDNDWQSGPGGFGAEGTPGAVIGTKWDTPDIWIRREFRINELPSQGELLLNLHHDEDAQIYLNGQLVQSVNGYVGEYSFFSLNTKVAKALKVGRNTLAIHCHQTRGGQFIDAGLNLIIDLHN